MAAAIDYALSIGPNCRAKQQLLRRYGAVAVGGVFDWQQTPLPTILAYLNNDFTGMFELRDLELQNGVVCNARFDTKHQHEFPTGMSQQAEIAASYPRARSRHDHICATTRRTLQSGRPLLLAMSATLEPQWRADLEQALNFYAGPAAELHFVTEPAPPDPALGWEGDPKVWDAMLAPYPPRFAQVVRLTLRSMTRPHHRRPPRRYAK